MAIRAHSVRIKWSNSQKELSRYELDFEDAFQLALEVTEVSVVTVQMRQRKGGAFVWDVVAIHHRYEGNRDYFRIRDEWKEKLKAEK